MARKSARQKIGEIKFGVTFKAEKEFRNKAGQYITRIEKERRAERLLKFLSDLRDEFSFENYPPESSANMPPPPYYIRHKGQQISDEINLLNSQKFGSSWLYGVEYTAGTPEGYLKSDKGDGTPVTYAPYLVGRGTQAGFHAQRGWPIFEDVVDDFVDNFEIVLAQEYQKDLEEIVEDL